MKKRRKNNLSYNEWWIQNNNKPHENPVRISDADKVKLMELRNSPEVQARPVVDRRET